MEIVSLPDAPSRTKTVTALGYFDGGHRGHLALLEETVALAKKLGCKSTVFSFSELPTKKGAPLSRTADRLTFFESAGIDRVILAPFASVQTMRAEDFVKRVLVERLGTVRAVCGFNYRFGFGAAGDATLLTQLLPGSTVVPPLLYGDAPISSTRIREALTAGDLTAANGMLGRLYTVTGCVTRGKALGRSLGFPTANIKPETALPRFGVYKTVVLVDETLYTGLSDVGVRPTVEGEGEVRIETFLPRFSGDLYGKEIAVSFLSFLREEQRFESAEALAEQIARDLANIQE